MAQRAQHTSCCSPGVQLRRQTSSCLAMRHLLWLKVGQRANAHVLGQPHAALARARYFPGKIHVTSKYGPTWWSVSQQQPAAVACGFHVPTAAHAACNHLHTAGFLATLGYRLLLARAMQSMFLVTCCRCYAAKVPHLLELVAGDRWLRETLEPGVVVAVEAPALPLQLVRGQKLLVCVGLEVEREEQALGVHLRVCKIAGCISP